MDLDLTKISDIWNSLVNAASLKEKLTYTDLENKVGIHHRHQGAFLERIKLYCEYERLPLLTVLVINKAEGKPGSGFGKATPEEIKIETQKVFDLDWESLINPFFVGTEEQLLSLTKGQFLNVLDYSEPSTHEKKFALTQDEISALTIIKLAEDCMLDVKMLASEMEFANLQSVINTIEQIGKKIVSFYLSSLKQPINSDYWRVIADGEEEKNGNLNLKLKQTFIDALKEINILKDSDYNIYPEEAPIELKEGSKKIIKSAVYERNPIARKKCIEHYSAKCFVCGFDFSEFYGKNIGEGFIHVHHVVEISSVGGEYKVDPIKDLRPVCPNCHAMLHRRKPAYSIEELKMMINK